MIGADGRRSTVAALAGAWTPVPDLAERPGPRVPLHGRPPRGHRRRRDLLAVAGGQLVRVRVPDDPRRQAAGAADGPPRRGRRGEARPRALLASASSASIPASPRGSRARRALLEAPLDRPTRRPSSAPPRARGGRWPATPDTSRTPSPGRACATRCSPGARSRSRSCRCSTTPSPSIARPAGGRPTVTASACPRTTSPTPTPSSSARRPALCELVRDAGRTPTPDISDLFGRARTPQQIAPLSRAVPCLRDGARARGAPALGNARPRPLGPAHRARDPPRAPRRPLPLDAH